VNSGIFRYRALTGLIAVISLLCSSPIRVSLWQLTENGLQPSAWQLANPVLSAPQPKVNELKLENGSVTIFSSPGSWESPSTWQVQQAVWTDLNHDGNPEATLLVRRPFEPWPVDRVLPHGGRIQSHQDSEGMSSHIIMIGWKKDHWGDVWAGSALARPVLQFEVADLNQDGKQELVVLEGDYKKSGLLQPDSLAVWQWNGFGFDLVSRIEKPVSDFMILETRQLGEIILTN
jgi:hypothetical protein